MLGLRCWETFFLNPENTINLLATDNVETKGESTWVIGLFGKLLSPDCSFPKRLTGPMGRIW